jgi:hypothetical protein
MTWTARVAFPSVELVPPGAHWSVKEQCSHLLNLKFPAVRQESGAL